MDLITVKSNKNEKGINQYSNIDYPEQSIINSYNELRSLKDVALMYNLDNRTIKKILIKNNIPIIGRGYATNPFTYNPFNNKTIEDKSYWFGYIAGDGYIEANKNGVIISTTDIDIVEQYKEFIGDILKIYKVERKTKDIYILKVSNKDLKDYLVNRGITTKKSKTLRLKVKLNWDIIRGLFDADGNINLNTGFKITTGSESLKNQLFTFFSNEGFIVSINIKDKKSKNVTYDIYIRTGNKPMKDIYKLLSNKLYPTNCKYYLKRKKEIMDTICGNTY